MKKFLFITSLLAAIFLSCPNLTAQNQSDVFKAEALNQMKFGRYGEAIDLLNKFISAQPRIAEGYYLRGVCYEKRAQYEWAVHDYRAAKKLDPKNKEISASLDNATNAWYRLLYNKIEGHKREIAIYPSRAVNYLEIGKSYKNLGEWLTAEEWYDKYIALEEPSADEVIRYTEILAKNNHISKGEKILKIYVEKYPDDHRLWSRYGYFTMWLGKYKIAIESFENALELRPFFKEAQDGLDLAKGKGYVYTYFDTTARYRAGPPKAPEYPIDRYYRLVRRNPGDDETRFLLVKELTAVNRLEEAKAQLDILSDKYSTTERFITLWDKVKTARDSLYALKILDYKANLERNPHDKESIIKLGEYYSYINEFNKSIEVFDTYLSLFPEDREVRNQYAKFASWNKDFERALGQTEIILKQDPNDLNAQFLNGQISVWLNRNLDRSERYLTAVYAKQPENLQALLALSTLYLQKNDYAQAQKFSGLAKNIDPMNKDLIKLQYSLNLQKERQREAELYNKLQEARRLVFEKNCFEAVKYYEEYIASTEAERIIYKEYANALACARDYKKSVAVFDSLLAKEYDYDLDKEKSKVIFWSGDSVSALKAFKALAAKNPDDNEAKIFLGDSYFYMKQYENAKKVYDELLASSPSSHIIRTRIGWLPPEFRDGGFPGKRSFPTYVFVSPEAYYYSDNLDFRYNYQGARAEFGVSNSITLAASAYNGRISSKNDFLNLSMLKAYLILRFSKMVSLSTGIGRTFFSDNSSKSINEITLKAETHDRYQIAASYSTTDAAQLLYSPYLVKTRYTVDNLMISGYYYVSDGLRLTGYYSTLTISDDNKGTNMLLRVGKEMSKDVAAGYEYYFSDYSRSSTLYYSPKNFEAHSVWGDWEVLNENQFVAKIGGKLGIIPVSNYVLRDFYGYISYKMSDNFSLQGRLSYGSTIRSLTGYSATAFSIMAFWTL